MTKTSISRTTPLGEVGVGATRQMKAGEPIVTTMLEVEAIPIISTINVVAKSWSSLAAEKKLTSKGMPLKSVAPNVKNGKSIAQIDKIEVEKLSDIWVNVVVLYVVGQKATIGAIIRFINLKWNNVSKLKVFLHEDVYFLLKFESVEDINEILYSGPLTLNDRPMIVEARTSNLYFHDETMRVVPLWVRFRNHPLNYSELA